MSPGPSFVVVARAPLASSREVMKFSPPVAGRGSATLTNSVVLGLTTQISNPKTAIVYASNFSVALPGDPSYGFGLGCVGIIFIIEAGWYSAVALLFSSRRPRARYLASKVVFDRLAATVMEMLGLKILSEAR